MSAPALRGLPRTVLRLHRASLIVWLLFVLAAIATLVWTVEVTADGALREQDYCARHDRCTVLTTMAYADRIGLVGAFACYSFLAVAAFAGGALIGRELENGTARLAWTQGISPARWLAAKLTVPAVALVLGGTALILAFRWGWGAHRSLMEDNWLFDTVFVPRGPALVAYALCALAIGTLTALVLRRGLPTMSLSFIVMLVLHGVLAFNRTSLWPTVTRVSSTYIELPNDVWHKENGTIVNGRRVEGVDFSLCDGRPPSQTTACLREHGVTGYYAVYHPQSHYWPLHLVETGIVLAVAAVAVLVAFRVLGRVTGGAHPRKEAPV
ncbi:hypothetical protein [Streptomyces sp. YU58]|uniref:hypothetical protein n=1 Tax=Streptomyces sp. SX92 TaxID=3158972 RepID=UPI0027B96BD8|nr:hypothetical protein [Streptomyces coralus]WLW53975.1 hypothetical protein QU709_22640 [Streptomyces coralus]